MFGRQLIKKSILWLSGVMLLFISMNIAFLQHVPAEPHIVSPLLFFANPRLLEAIKLSFTTPHPSQYHLDISKYPQAGVLSFIATEQIPILGGFRVDHTYAFLCIDQSTCYGKSLTFQADLVDTLTKTVVEIANINLEVRCTAILRDSAFYWENPSTPEVRNLFPVVDIWRAQHYRSCAVVGNGGSLIGSKLGTEIDSHDIVMRFNRAPVIPFEEDVGTKLDIGFVVNTLVSQNLCWQWNDSRVYELPKMVLTHHSPEQVAALQDCQTKHPHTKIYFWDWTFYSLIQAILQEQGLLSNIPAENAPVPSTGFNAVFAASLICEKITIYGFWNGKENSKFVDSNGKEWKGHHYPSEKKIIEDLRIGVRDFLSLENPFRISSDLVIEYGADRIKALQYTTEVSNRSDTPTVLHKKVLDVNSTMSI